MAWSYTGPKAIKVDRLFDMGFESMNLQPEKSKQPAQPVTAVRRPPPAAVAPGTGKACLTYQRGISKEFCLASGKLYRKCELIKDAKPHQPFVWARGGRSGSFQEGLRYSDG